MVRQITVPAVSGHKVDGRVRLTYGKACNLVFQIHVLQMGFCNKVETVILCRQLCRRRDVSGCDNDVWLKMRFPEDTFCGMARHLILLLHDNRRVLQPAYIHVRIFTVRAGFSKPYKIISPAHDQNQLFVGNDFIVDVRIFFDQIKKGQVDLARKDQLS